MIDSPRRGYLVAGVEAELDMGPKALAALDQAEFTVALSAYRNATTDAAHVMLPITPFTETGGTFVNMEGRAQTFNAVVKPQSDARPMWKVLRMLGTLLELPGFHGYSLIDAGDGVMTSVGFFDTAAQADESTRIAAGWLREQKLETALPNAPKLTSGAVVVHKTRELVQA